MRVRATCSRKLSRIAAAAPSLMRDLSRLLRPRSIALFGGGWAENVVAQLAEVRLPRRHLAGPPHPRRHRAASPATATSPTFRPPGRRLRRRQPRGHRRGRPPPRRARAPAAPSASPPASSRARPRHRRRRAPGPPGRGRRRHADPRPELLRPPQLPRQRHPLARPARRPCRSRAASPSSPSPPTSPSTSPCSGAPCRSPISLTAGNQAQTGLADLAAAALDDPRVTALGLYVEGFGDIRAFEAMAAPRPRRGQARRRAEGRPLRAVARRHPHPHRLARRRRRRLLGLPRPPRHRRGRARSASCSKP